MMTQFPGSLTLKGHTDIHLDSKAKVGQSAQGESFHFSPFSLVKCLLFTSTPTPEIAIYLLHGPVEMWAGEIG